MNYVNQEKGIIVTKLLLIAAICSMSFACSTGSREKSGGQSVNITGTDPASNATSGRATSRPNARNDDTPPISMTGSDVSEFPAPRPINGSPSTSPPEPIKPSIEKSTIVIVDPPTQTSPLPVVAKAKIIDFHANPTSVVSGDTITLQWRTENADSVRLGTGKDFSDVPKSGTTSFRPSATPIQLIARSGIGPNAVEEIKAIAIEIKQPSPTSPKAAKPKITEFRADPPSIVMGSSTRLHWKTVDADRVQLGVANNLHDVEKSGTEIVTPSTQPYRLIARSGKEGVHDLEMSKELQIKITSPKPPEPSALSPTIIFFQADPPSIMSGNPVMLEWQTEDADSVQLSAQPGGAVPNVEKSGSKEVKPGVTTTYKLTVRSNIGGQKYAEVSEDLRILVSIPKIRSEESRGPQIRIFSANPPAMRPSKQTTIKWEVSNTERITISCDDGTKMDGRIQSAAEAPDIKSETAKLLDRNQVRIPPIRTPRTPQLNDARDKVVTPKLLPLDANQDLISQQGERFFKPTKTTKCTLVAAKAAQNVKDEITITVIPVVKQFELQPAGKDTYRLIWNVDGADSVRIEGIDDKLPSKGDRIVTPNKDLQYRITAKGSSKEPFDFAKKVIRIPKSMKIEK